MISAPAKWHANRRKEILEKHPEIGQIPKYNPLALIPILGIPVIQFLAAYSAQYLPFWLIFILAWTVGGFCSFAMFNNLHELCHRLVHPKIKGKWFEILMSVACVPSVTLQTYALFRWGHLPHHASFGGHSVDEAKDFLREPHPDIELLIDQYFYELPQHREEDPHHILPFIFKHPVLRVIFAVFISPFIGVVRGIIFVPIFIIVSLIKCLFKKEDVNYIKKVKSLSIQLAVTYAVLIVLYGLAGPYALVYLFLSELCARGFLFHPGIIFALSTHKTWGTPESHQPTTSTYGRTIRWVLMNINYHVEHHDFPDIPRRYLPKVKKLAPEYYETLQSFKGGTGVFRDYYQSLHWIYAGVFKKLPKT